MNSCSAGAIPYLWVRLYFFIFGAVKVAKQSCLSLNLYWWALSFAKKICSPALLAATLSNGGSRCQGSWIAVSNVAWIYVSTWIQGSLQCKANKSVGCLRWTTWWLPLVVPGSLFETCFCKVIIVRTLLSDDFVPFGKTNVLETLTYKVEQCRTLFRERDEVLGLKSCLIRRDMSGSPGGHAVYQAYGISKDSHVYSLVSS